MKDYAPELDPCAVGIRYLGSSLLLRAQTSIRHYFRLEAGSIEDYRFSLDGAPVIPQRIGSRYFVELTGISACELDRVFTLRVTDPSGNSTTVSYCALSYAYTVLEDEESSGTLKDVVRALVLYHQTAETYFAAIKAN